MKKILYLFFYIIIILYIGTIIHRKYSKSIDTFEALPQSDNISSIDDSYGKIITTYKNPHNHKNCCLVKKVYNKTKDEFEYNYKKLESCNYNMIPAIHHNHMNLFIDGVNGWNNRKCKKPDDSKDRYYLGSCKKINFECKDFMTSNQCKKYDMEWSDKTCYTKYAKPFKILKRKIANNSKVINI